MSNEISKDAKERLAFNGLFSSPLNHLVVLHRVLYGTIEPELALAYLHQHLREDADLADMGRPLKCQYQENANCGGAAAHDSETTTDGNGGCLS